MPSLVYSASGVEYSTIIQSPAILAQGSQPPTGYHVKESGFALLVLCAEEFQPPASAFQGIEVIHAPNDDNLDPLDGKRLNQVIQTARTVEDALRDGLNVLVTCYMGVNRSGLVTGIALHGLLGVSGAKACKMIKSARPFALTNPVFTDFLLSLPGRKIGA